MATKKIKRFQEGGMSDKERGLEASKDDKVGFFERLRMGNIDDEGSEAYRRFGAGRGRAESVPVEDRTPTPVIRESAKPTPAIQESAKPTPAPMDAMDEANKREPIPVPAGPKAKPSAPIKAAPKPSVKNEYAAAPKKDTSNHSNEGRGSKPATSAASPKGSDYSNEGRGREMTKKQQMEYGIDSIRPTPKQTQEGLEAATSMMGGAGLKGLHTLAKKVAGTAGAAAKPAGSRAVSTAVDDGVTFLGKSGRRQVGGFDELPAPAAKSIADGTRKAISGEAGKKSLPSPTKRLAYDKAGAIAKRRADRASKRRDEMLDENAKNYGLDPKAPGYEAASGAVRKELGGKDFTFKKGGKVKSMKMSSGGSTSPASKRADGIATRGKTRCKIC